MAVNIIFNVILYSTLPLFTHSGFTCDPPEPTPSPTFDIQPCDIGKLDTVILNDISCKMTLEQCKSQQQFIADTMKSIKGADTNAPNSRVAYIEYDTSMLSMKVKMNQAPYNKYSGGISDDVISNYHSLIKDSPICNADSLAKRNSTPDLWDAMDAAFNEFKLQPRSDDKQRDKKIIIFSNCKADNINDICEEYESQIFGGNTGNGINIIMINQGDNTMDDYIMCLVEYDHDRIFINPEYDVTTFYNDLLPKIKDQVCSAPTSAPTTDPTTDPTTQPSPQTTSMGRTRRRRARRRLLETSTLTPVESLSNGLSPDKSCIMIELTVSVENILPDPSIADPRTNIWQLGESLNCVMESNGINADASGVIMLPGQDYNISDNEHDDWIPDDECINNDNTVINEEYSDEIINNDTGINYTEIDGKIVFDFVIQTASSIIYQFYLPDISLNITTTCVDGLPFKLYVDNMDTNTNLYTSDDAIILLPSDDFLYFKWDNQLHLDSDTRFLVKIELIEWGLCDITNIIIDGDLIQRRRRLSSDDDDDDSFISLANIGLCAQASVCDLGQTISQSDSMSYAMSSYCGKERPADIEEGLFRKRIGQNAIQQHLISTGSLDIFDEHGNLTIKMETSGASEPCVAIDYDTNRIYLIGGYDPITNDTTDIIEVFQINEDFTAATKLESSTDTCTGFPVTKYYTNLKLDKPRFATSCAFYKQQDCSEYLVVVGGIGKYSDLNGPRSAWYQDLKIYSLKTSGNFLFPDYKPNDDSILMPKGGFASGYEKIMDPKPYININELWLVGGRSAKNSKQQVSKINLDTIISDDTANFTALTQLNHQRSTPLVDLVSIEFDDGSSSSCSMIYGGLDYDSSSCSLFEGNCPVDKDTMELFCNDDLTATKICPDGQSDSEECLTARRRLNSNNDIPKFTEFDLSMRKTKTMYQQRRRRRLQDQGKEVNEAKIFIKKYNFTNDGIWYTIKANLTFCFENNNDLEKVETFYKDIINDYRIDGDIWSVFNETLKDCMLNCSSTVYNNWSNGFGDAKIKNVRIVDVNYVITPTPTVNKIKSHPERRKARHWWNNIMEKSNTNDNIWIDKKYLYQLSESDDQNTDDDGLFINF